MVVVKCCRWNKFTFAFPFPEHLQYIPRNMHTVFALLCFVVVIHWLIFPYPSGLLHWHCGNLTIAPVPAKQPWWIWINTSCEFIMNDCITTTKQSTTKPYAYFLGYTVRRHCASMCHIYGAITLRWRHKSPASRLFAQPFIQAKMKENIKAPRHWPLWGEFTVVRWIPPHTGPVRRKMFPFDDVTMLAWQYEIMARDRIWLICSKYGYWWKK